MRACLLLRVADDALTECLDHPRNLQAMRAKEPDVDARLDDIVAWCGDPPLHEITYNGLTYICVITPFS